MRANGTIFLAVFAAGLLYAASLSAATIEVQAVTASSPGGAATIPDDLAKYKQPLQNSGYGHFASAGNQSVTLGAGKKGSLRFGSYDVEFSITVCAPGKCAFEVMIKDGGKPIADRPMAYEKSAGSPPIIIKLGDPKAPTILILTPK